MATHSTGSTSHEGHGIEAKLKDFDRKYLETKAFLTSAGIESARIYVEAADKFLKDAEGNYDYLKIDTTLFAQFVGERYANFAKEQFYKLPDSVHWTEIQQAAAMKGIFGMNSASITNSIREAGENYSINTHMGEQGINHAIIKNITQTLYPTTTTQFVQADVPEIIDYIGFKGKVKLDMPIDYAAHLLLNYKTNDGLSLKHVDKKYLISEHGHEDHPVH